MEKTIIVLNKIDLIPREIAAAWIRQLKSEYSTVVVGVSALDSVDPIIEVLPSEQAQNIVITGIGNSGKRTIADKLKTAGYNNRITGKWDWLLDTGHLGLVGHTDRCSSTKLTMNLFSASIHTIMTAMSIMNVEDILTILAPEALTSNAAAKTVCGLFSSGTIFFYQPPNHRFFKEDDSFTPVQIEALKKVLPVDARHDQYVVFTEIEQNRVKRSVLASILASSPLQEAIGSQQSE